MIVFHTILILEVANYGNPLKTLRQTNRYLINTTYCVKINQMFHDF